MTLKDCVFQKRHGTELSAQIKNQVNDLSKSILMLITDGGGDHNITHASVQASLLALFVSQDLDFLCAMRTCPTQSWTNLAERVMSILNIALQHCALQRDEMSNQFEDIIKKSNSMSKLRSEASNLEELQESFTTSMQSVISLVESRFESMKLKENYIQCTKACNDNDIDIFFQFLHRIDEISIEKNSPLLTSLLIRITLSLFLTTARQQHTRIRYGNVRKNLVPTAFFILCGCL